MTPQTALRGPGRPPGTVKRHTPKVRVRVSLESHTVEAMERCAKAAGLEIGPWLDFTIADLESKGRLLNERRERDLQIREMRWFATATIALLRAESIEHFLELAELAMRYRLPLNQM